ncbi:Branched-chain amino acid transport system substrate-binding protein [Candidatus Magnetaquicoccaceae bacterium FCR-1]|uniref:Branched-chain amino acid transport system substrate-binding protein n=1 Tax=Candidatus Magnetaquiglobus chichijimensis TaxID=3141448 RepID=A0ABQ0CDG4_9PROT
MRATFLSALRQATLVLALFSIQPVAAAEIPIGMSTPLESGPVALGQNTRLGVEAYFNAVNKNGGVHGQTLKLIALDDGYEPTRAAVNMRALIEDKKVLAVIGNVGTPTAVVAAPIANETRTILIGAITGAGLLRKNPPERYIFNYRASYAEETAAMIDGLLGLGIKPREIAFFTQNDGYGDSGHAGAVAALKKHGFTDTDTLAHGRYTRNTTHIEGALASILDAETEPRAIIMVGAYPACAAFIREARKDLPNALFINVSFVGSAALAKALGKDGEGVIVTQVTPSLSDTLPGVQAYHKALKQLDPKATADFLSLEGYLAARLLVEGIERAKPTGKPREDREALVKSLESLNDFDLGIGIPVRFDPKDHQASHKVWPTRLVHGEFQPFAWSQLR